MDKFNNLFKPISHPIAGFGNVKLDVKDLDYLTNMDANMPLNWFDIRYKITNEAKLDPVPYIKDLCGKPSAGKKNAIKYKEEVQCNQDGAADKAEVAPAPTAPAETKATAPVPETKVPETKAPETKAPETKAPEAPAAAVAPAK